MVTEKQYRFVLLALRAGMFTAAPGMFGPVNVFARPGFRWLLNRLRDRQQVDSYHHAPACPANHFHRMRLVFDKCSCGAVTQADGEVKP